jgi:hypothetical protein
MLRRIAYFIALATFAFAGLSCSGDDSPTEPGPESGDQAVTRTIDPTGGQITATASGTTVILTFPAGAVRVPTEITLRPTEAAEGSLFGLLLEPANMVFYEAFTVEAVLTDRTRVDDLYLVLGDPADPMYLPTDLDASTPALSTSLNFFGLTGDTTGRPARTTLAATPANQLGTASASCQAMVATLKTRFDFYVAQGDFMEAIELTKTILATLDPKRCASEIGDWRDTAEQTACDGLDAALTEALATPTDDFGTFYEQVQPIVEFESILQSLTFNPNCPALADVEGTIDAEINDYIGFFKQRASSLQSGDWGGFLEVKQEVLSAYQLVGAAMSLDAYDAAADIETLAQQPAADWLREVAYDFCINDGWHYPLSRMTSTGFFAPRDFAGTTPTFTNPPASQIGTFTDNDIWEDLQYCGTDLDVTSMVASGGDLATERVGSDGGPGQLVDEISLLPTPTRGRLRLSNRLDAFWCWNDIEADQEIALRINAKDVLTISRPPGGDSYIPGPPEFLDIAEMAKNAGITPAGGNTTFVTVVRRRAQCDAAVWGPDEYELFQWGLAWQNPTTETTIEMPANVQPGDTVDVIVRVKVIDQLDQAGFFEGIDIALQSAGGVLDALSGQTDAQGYFRTRVTVDSPGIGPEGAPRAVSSLQVDATSTTFEGVTSSDQASATVGAGGTTRILYVGHTSEVRVYGFSQVTRDTGDYIDPPNPGPWSWSGSVQADSTADGKSFSAHASTNVNTSLSVSGDALVSFGGTISGSSDLSANGDFATNRIPSSTQSAEPGVKFEVVGGNVTYSFTASASASGDYLLWAELHGNGINEGFYASAPDPLPSPVQVSGVLPPGQYWIDVFAQSQNQCTDCSTSGSSSITWQFTVGAN